MYEETTDGLLVRATPEFLPSESAPEQSRYVWAYTIEIENRSRDVVQLISRYWRIIDQNGHVQDVRGEGVVGQQPIIQPGGSFRYTSAAPLSAPSGIMSGAYTLERVQDGHRFEIATPAFPLDSPDQAKWTN